MRVRYWGPAGHGGVFVRNWPDKPLTGLIVMNHSPSNSLRAAWTLIELLVVITIVAVLAAILLPVLGRTKDAARATGCITHIRAYGNAVVAFIADNNRSLPDRSTEDLRKTTGLAFTTWIQPYLDGPVKDLHCPIANAEERETDSGFGYSGNGALTESYPRPYDVPAPASRIVLAAEMYYWDGFLTAAHLNRTIWGNAGGVDPVDEGTKRRPQYHGSRDHRGLHLYFLDGHVELVSATNNNWKNSPTYGNATNGGPYYDVSQFLRMKQGR